MKISKEYYKEERSETMRIISLCPSNTELLAYLGVIDDVIGVDDYSDWPNLDHCKRLGPDLSIDIDAVEELNPDLILASLSVPGMERNVEELAKRGLPFITLNPQSLVDIAEDLRTVGKAIGQKEKGEELSQHFLVYIHQYKIITSSVEQKPSLYWEWWPKPVFTPGGINWLTEVSELAGGRNSFSDVEQANIQTDWETVRQKNPDHICMAWVGVQTKKMKPSLLKKREGWLSIKAIKQQNVHVLEEEYYCRPSPRLLIGLKKLAPLIHPTLFPSFDGKDPLLDRD